MWCRRDDNYTPFTRIRRVFDIALKSAGLPLIHFHDLRHSFASNLVAAGASLVVVKELLGHKKIETTMIYAHLAPDQKRDAVAMLVAAEHESDAQAHQRTLSS